MRTACLALRAGQRVRPPVREFLAALGVGHLPQVRAGRPHGVEVLLAGAGEEQAKHDPGAVGRPHGLIGEVAAGTYVEPDLLERGAVRMDCEHLSVLAAEQDPLAVRGLPGSSAKSGAVILRRPLPSVFTTNRAPGSVLGSLFLRNTILLPRQPALGGRRTQPVRRAESGGDLAGAGVGAAADRATRPAACALHPRAAHGQSAVDR